MVKVRFTGTTDNLKELGAVHIVQIGDRKFMFDKASECAGKVDVDYIEIPPEVKPKFDVGSYVTKAEGYAFSGVVRATYKNKDGFYRVVVEHDDGWAHIFNEGQLVAIPAPKPTWVWNK